MRSTRPSRHCSAGRLAVFVAPLALLALSSAASAQTQIRPRVLVMVDTSGSMTSHFTDNNDTGGDGSTLYTDGLMTRGLTQTPGFGLYTGNLLTGTCNAPSNLLTAYDGINSRLFAAKDGPLWDSATFNVSSANAILTAQSCSLWPMRNAARVP